MIVERKRDNIFVRENIAKYKKVKEKEKKRERDRREVKKNIEWKREKVC